MSHPTTKPSTISNSRCQHRYAHNKRCRLSISNRDSAFCPIHSKLPGHEADSSEVAAALTDNLSEFRSAIPINDFLSRVLLLLAQDRISPKKAAVLTFISSQLLRTLPIIDRELNPAEDDKDVQIIFDLPRPERPDYVKSPQTAPASLSQLASSAEPQPASSAPPQAASRAQSTSQAVPSASQPDSQPSVSSRAGSPAAPATMPPIPPGSFGLPQADPPGTSRVTSTRQHVRQPTWADLRT